MAHPLSTAMLHDPPQWLLSSGLTLPRYERSSLTRSILHLGVGGFHRAHFATYIDDLCGKGHTEWSIVGSGITTFDLKMEDALTSQDCLYTLITRATESITARIIGSIVEYIGPASVDRIIARIADPKIQIVSMTITEGGYPVDDATGEYLRSSDVAGPDSAFGLIASGLQLRRANGAGPLTIMSFDNIIGNGDVAATSTFGQAALLDESLPEWIAQNVAFPNSMVDRITPATGPQQAAWLAETFDVIDRWPVPTEPFRQWVVEDNFAGDRLPLEDLDVIVTADVGPYETVKLRLLNAGHSCIAYLSALSDIATVAEALENPAINSFLRRFLLTEAKPSVPEVDGINLDTYVNDVIERFSNPEIGDQISRLCLDGSAKFPKFLLPTIRYNVRTGGPIAAGALALAGWCEYLLGVSNSGQHITLASDPLLEQARQFAIRSIDDPTAFLHFEEVFGTELGASEEFGSAFGAALSALRDGDVPSAIAETLHTRDQSE